MAGTTVTVVDSAVNCPDLPIVQGEGHAQAVIWPGTGAEYRSFHIIDLSSRASTTALCHKGDAAYYVMGGAGVILDLATGERFEMAEGAMVHIDAADRYQFTAGENGFKLLGGPCPPDETLYAHLPRA